MSGYPRSASNATISAASARWLSSSSRPRSVPTMGPWWGPQPRWSTSLTVHPWASGSLRRVAIEVRQARAEEYHEAGRITAEAYREFVRPGEEPWERYLEHIADVAGRAARTT